ncbi:hypothetical protein DHEL01_v210407 [Diaporthe helianthi]|uniref:CorA-like Mg2+ transporter n=1 Tax=Diaporthe helianthi TaxID=158607 RepID=A0A2P5HLR3_DIAHE|nr:hypothetical protein DHEL01_v210407 [Diaporthe helianthi]
MENIGEVKFDTRGDGVSFTTSEGSTRKLQIRSQNESDLSEWDHLEDTRQYASGFIERTMNSYLQAATAEVAKFANLQAKTSKKITFLATLFVPASLCAAVLALPGYSGAQGAQRLWLFWVVSVPIAIILAVTLLFKDLRKFINDQREKSKSPMTISDRALSYFPDILQVFSRRRRLVKAGQSDLETRASTIQYTST